MRIHLYEIWVKDLPIIPSNDRFLQARLYLPGEALIGYQAGRWASINFFIEEGHPENTSQDVSMIHQDREYLDGNPTTTSEIEIANGRYYRYRGVLDISTTAVANLITQGRAWQEASIREERANSALARATQTLADRIGQELLH